MSQHRRSLDSWARAPRTGVIVGIGLAVALVLILVGTLNSPSSRRAELWLEMAKTGMQFGVIVILGALVTQVLKRRDEQREEWRRLAEYRLQILRESVDAYNRAKAVRRALRALGFRREPPPAGLDGPPTPEPLSDAQIAGFHAQMLALNDAQLELERLGRDVEARNDLFSQAGRMRDELDAAEQYLGEVLRTWEQRQDLIKVGGDPTRLVDLEELQAFLGSPTGKKGLTCNLSDRMGKFREAVLADLLPRRDGADWDSASEEPGALESRPAASGVSGDRR